MHCMIACTFWGALVDQETINRIAGELARQIPSPWPVGVWIAAAVGGLVGAVGGFFGEYFRTRGRNLATKADFVELLRQAQKTTETVEAIKAEVGYRDWAKREWVNNRRLKLEELFRLLNTCDHWLQTYRDTCIEGKYNNTIDPAHDMITLANMYFLEIDCEISAYRVARLELFRAFNSKLVEIAHAPSPEKRKEAVGSFREDTALLSLRYRECREHVRALSRVTLQSIMGGDLN